MAAEFPPPLPTLAPASGERPLPDGLHPDRVLAGRYRLVRRLARGGMAEVWEAVDDILTRPVAIKVLLPHLAADDAFVQRFRREAIAAARLSHPHIVAIFDTCTNCGVEAIVMELVRGRTLRDLLDETPALPFAQAVDIAAQVADALDHAARSGLVHRDVKPGNILLSVDGRVLVTDFGIAKAAEAVSDLTEVGQVIGTAKYLAPEQVQGGPLDNRADVYGLGVVLFEMVCGRPPFVGDNSTAVAMARLTGPPPRPRSLRPEVPVELEAVVLRALARDPDERIASPGAMRAALLALDLDAPRGQSGDTTVAAATPDRTLYAASTPRAAPFPAPERPGGAPRVSVPAVPSPIRAARRRRRRWGTTISLLVVVAATLGLVAGLLSGTSLGRGLFDALRRGPGAIDEVTDRVEEEVSGGPQAVSLRATTFDPFGTDGEHDDEVGNLVDGDDATTWTTERYRSELRNSKDGVGVVLTLDQVSGLDRLEVRSPTVGWAAEVYVATDRAPDDFDGWGDPVTSEDGLDGDASFDLDGRTGAAVLLWLTDVGDGPEPGQAALREASIFA